MSRLPAARSRAASWAAALPSWAAGLPSWAAALPSWPAARRAPRGVLPAGVVAVAGTLIALAYGQQYTGSVFVLAACYAIVTAGMAVQIGFSQQIAFSQSVFMGVGAYGVAMLNTHFAMPVLLATPIVLVGAAVVALVLAWPRGLGFESAVSG